MIQLPVRKPGEPINHTWYVVHLTFLSALVVALLLVIKIGDYLFT